MANVLVTGASGHAGLRIVRAFLERGDLVTAVTNSPVTAAAVSELYRNRRLAVAAADLGVGAPKVEGAFDSVIHAAACVPNGSAEDDDVRRLFDVNFLGTARLLASLRHRARRIVYLSSIAVYAPCPVLDEDNEPQPQTAYGASKLAGERAVELWAGETEAPAAILRVGTIYGPGERLARVLTTFFARAMDNRPLFVEAMGRARRNYVYVDDVARAVVNTVERGLTGTFNLAGDETFTLERLADEVVRAAESCSVVRLLPGAVRDLIVSTTRLDLTGIGCPTPLAQGLDRQAAWIRAGGPRFWSEPTATPLPQSDS